MINEINYILFQSLFKIPELDYRKLERYLYKYGKVYFHVFNGELTFHPFRVVSFNANDEPNNIELFSEYGAFKKQLFNEEIDLKAMMLAFDYWVEPKAVVSAYNEVIADINITNSRTLDTLKLGYVVSGDPSLQQSLNKFFKGLRKPDKACPVFVLSGTQFTADQLKLFNTDRDIYIDKLQDYKNELKGECYQFFGVDSLDTDKKERLIVDEINANNTVYSLSLERQKSNRQLVVDYLNENKELFRLEKPLTLICTIDIVKLEVQEKEEVGEAQGGKDNEE